MKANCLGLIVIALTTIFATALVALTPWVATRLKLSPLPKWWPIVFTMSAAMALVFSLCVERSISLEPITVFALAVGAAALAMLVVIDLNEKRLPRLLSLSTFAIVTVCLLLSQPIHERIDVLYGAVAITVISVLLFLLARGAFGIGDVLLSPLLGAIMGWFAISAIVVFWMATAISGAIVSLFVILARKTKQTRVIPYGPFMVIGLLTSVIWSVR